MKTDAQIQLRVLEELQWDPRVEAADIDVEVSHGVVTLTGTVSRFTKRLAAEDAAHRVAGVLDVANDIQVRVPDRWARTDTELAQAVRSALEEDVDVPEERIQSTVSGGVVMLAGSVDYWCEREDAERAVRHLPGVSGVMNRLSVQPAPRPAEEVRSEIEAALERRAERTAEHIEVRVEDGTVTVTGPVHSRSERDAVLGAARSAPGVQVVVDQLRIAW